MEVKTFMKERGLLTIAGAAAVLAFCSAPPPAQAAEKPPAHQEALPVETEDPVLKEQIDKVSQALNQLYHQMAQKRQAIQAAPDEARRSALSAELDVLRKEHDMLNRLLHDLISEAHATEWTDVDEALRRVKQFEQRQEREDQQEEALSDRKE